MGFYPLNVPPPFAASQGDIPRYPAPPAARADGPEPVPVQPVAAERVITGADAGGDDGGPVEAERIRQSRLKQWQTPAPR